MKPKIDKKHKDLNELAFSIVQQATDESHLKDTKKEPSDKNPNAVALGRLGGKKGGPARAKKLTEERRTQIARKAALKRWEKQTSK